jgi:hypothetical protein
MQSSSAMVTSEGNCECMDAKSCPAESNSENKKMT